MKPPLKVPFYSHPEDDLHCVQAAFRMILKYFLPDRNFSWPQLEKMSAMIPGGATWPMQMLLSLHEMGFELALIEGFDARSFIAGGGNYLEREFGAETAEWQIAHSDIPQEQRLYKKLLDTNVHYEHRIPDLEDIRRYMAKGYLVKVTVNSRRLNHRPGYVGHSLVVVEIDDKHIIVHDPAPPGREARVESIADFEAAWASPNDKAKELIAVKYKESR